MRYRLPVGEDDFAKVRQEYYFVDKSPFIREFMDRHGAVTLFTRPRRFGKTLTLSMLRYFFDIDHAEENRQLFEGLAIADDADAMQEQGTRPVVFLSLKEWKRLDWSGMQEEIRMRLANLFAEYGFLQNDALSSRDQQVFTAVLNEAANMSTLRNTLAFLLRLLEKHYGKKPILLLDEYDTPIQAAWSHGFYQEAISFFRGFLSSALKTNPSLDFAVLTGVLRISKESIFSDLNNLQVDSILSPRYPEAFGFTPAEVGRLAQDFGWQDKLPELRDWYDGYRFGGKEIYNPWSVLNYFANDCEPDTYWVNTSGNAILQGMLKRATADTWDTLQKILQGQPVRVTVREGFIYSEIYQNKNALYTMLLTTGYLTCQSVRRTDLGQKVELVLPNRELLALFRIEVLERCRVSYMSMDLDDLMQALLHGDVAMAQKGLAEYIETLVSAFDTGAKESFYHGFVLGMTAILVPDYEVQSNREAGKGRFNVAVFPKDTAKRGLLFEFKTASSEAELAAKADEALKQMAERDYIAPFRARGINEVHQYGVAFCGKQVYLKKMYE